MAKSTRRPSNELEFQGQVIVWLNEEIKKHPGLNLEKATQEKPRKSSGKRSDLIVWVDRANEIAFLAIELKTPITPINDPVFFTDAIEKAQHWKSKYFALWNMREFEVYQTPPPGDMVLPTNALRRSSSPLATTEVEEWLQPLVAAKLREQSIQILDAAGTGKLTGHTIDAEIFVTRLTDAIVTLRGIFHRDLAKAAATHRTLRKQLNNIAAVQGFSGFVKDIDYTIAGQIGYRFIGQILFYFALRRKIPSLKELRVSTSDDLPAAFQPYWNDVRRYDYDALFRPEPIEKLIPVPPEAQTLICRLIEQLGSYDWASMNDDVLGSIFERIIPPEEQVLLGQFYTPRAVADLLVAFAIDGQRPLILDPGCGSGTFLMSAYRYLAHTTGLAHKDLLSIIWGFDISSFAAELAVINLYRQDMSEFENFPRIVPCNFFESAPGDTVTFPAPRATSGTKRIPVPVPIFDCIIGNPPYLRSQNQDDLDPAYRSKLFQAAARAGIDATSKTDLFAFFVYHSVRFMKDASRLGFVTPASWLTADYAAALQEMLLGAVRLVAVIGSGAESFFPQVDINTVLLIAEKVDQQAEDAPIRFVTLKKKIAQLIAGNEEYWVRVIKIVREIEAHDSSIENERYRIKLVDPVTERRALQHDCSKPRNWSKYMRAPLSYYEVFEGGA